MSVAVNHACLETRLQALLARDAAAACLDTREGDMATLDLNERMAVARAVGRRQQEFAAGRMAARLAMHRLGRQQESVPVNPDRSPSWPAGLVGSISHSGTTCVAVVALDRSWHSVGVDVEPDLGLSPDLWDTILTPEEHRRVSQMPETLRERWATRVFCAKETYYKWVYPRLGLVLDFQAVVVEMDATLGSTRFGLRPLHSSAQKATPPGVQGTLTVAQGQLIGLLIH